MISEPKFTEISKYEQASQIYEYANSESDKYIDNKNLCDFFEDDEMTQKEYWNYIVENIKNNANKNTSLLNYVFIEEFDGKVFGYKDVSISKLPFFHPSTKKEEWIVAYIGEMCSFSRLKKLSEKYYFKNIGTKLFEDFKNFLIKKYKNKHILIWLLATESSKYFHFKNGMKSSGYYNRFITQFSSNKHQTIYQMFDKKEYGYDIDTNKIVLGKDEKFGENDLFYIIK
jgi:hypothetical protein